MCVMKNWNLGSKGFYYVCILSMVVLGLMTVICTGSGCSRSSNNETLEAKIITPKNDVYIKEGESVFFQGFASGGSPPYRYFWHFGAAASDSSEQNTGEIVFNFEGAYTATLTVTDRNGSKDNDSMRILVDPGEPDINELRNNKS